ncbi:hypothetical protein MMC21_002195 [Puttea exsequens]|nr:hypothetical protein [Puttea exsequens]
MSVSEELVDLSLFSDSPTNDYRFTTYVPEAPYQDDPSRPPIQDWQLVRQNLSDKPLPALPPRRVCPGVTVPRNCEIGADSQCILQRIKRNRTVPHSQANTLLQRRNPASHPQLTLSVPQTNPRSRSEASAMVWMEDEQMWLIAEEVERDVMQEVQGSAGGAMPSQTGYPSPPDYTPRASSSQAPAPSAVPTNNLTPPLTPLQSQLNSIYEPRDEERLSPLFQEAMNSIPMMDLSDNHPPPLEPRTFQSSRPKRTYTSAERPPPIPTSVFSTAPSRSISLGSRISDFTSSSSRTNSSRGYHSARESVAVPKTPSSRGYHSARESVAVPKIPTNLTSKGSYSARESVVVPKTPTNKGSYSARESVAEDLTQLSHSSRRWHTLARRMAGSSLGS